MAWLRPVPDEETHTCTAYKRYGTTIFLSAGYLSPNVLKYHRWALIALGNIQEISNTTNIHGGESKYPG